MDIDGDGKISKDGDVNILRRMDIEKINQNQYASNPQKIIYKFTKQVIEEYMNNLSDEFKNEYTVKVNEYGTYYIELNKDKNITVGEMISKLGDEYNRVTFYLYDAENDKETRITNKTSTEIVTNESSIHINFDRTYETDIYIVIE